MDTELQYAGFSDETALPGISESESQFPLTETSPTSASASEYTQVTPQTTGDWTISSLFGLLNVVAGLMIVASFLLFFGGFTTWISKLGLEGRLEGLRFMYYGITVLFMLIAILAIVNFVQYHTALVLAVLGFVIVIAVAWMVYQTTNAPPEEEH